MSGLPASLRFGPPGARPAGAAAAPRAAPAGGGKRRDEVSCHSSRLVSRGSTVAAHPDGWHPSAHHPQVPQDDAAAWRAECERAAPQLTVAVPADAGADGRDWRPLLERALAALGGLQAAAPAAQAATAASANRLTSQLEALAAGEASAGAQLAGLRAEHKAAQEAVAVLQREAEARREYVGQLQAELAFLNKVGRLRGGVEARAWLDASPTPSTPTIRYCCSESSAWPKPMPPPTRTWRSGSASWRSRGRA